MVVVVDPTSSLFPPEENEELIDIKTVENTGKNLALPNTIGEAESGRKDSLRDLPSKVS